MATLHEVRYSDDSKFSVNQDKNGNTYMNVYTGNVKDKDEHSHEDYQIGGDLKDGKAYKGGHEERGKSK